MKTAVFALLLVIPSLASAGEILIVTSDYDRDSRVFVSEWEREGWPLSKLRDAIERHYTVRFIDESEVYGCRDYPTVFIGRSQPFTLTASASGSAMVQLSRRISERHADVYLKTVHWKWDKSKRRYVEVEVYLKDGLIKAHEGLFRRPAVAPRWK